MEGLPAAQLGDPVNTGHGTAEDFPFSWHAQRGADGAGCPEVSAPLLCSCSSRSTEPRGRGVSTLPPLACASLPSQPPQGSGPPGFSARAWGEHRRGWHPAGRHFPLSLSFRAGDLLSPSPLRVDALSTPRLLPAASTRAGH